MRHIEDVETLDELNETIIKCVKCERLVKYREEVSRKRVRRYLHWDYWGKPLPGFGDPGARLLIVGLAPAAHGGNRTGRMFTGDSSGDWLIRALYEIGFANQPTSISIDDGLLVRDVYITAVVRCAPPKNRPLRSEIMNCNPYLLKEIDLLRNLRVITTLGRIAFDNTLRSLRTLYPAFDYRRYSFSHGARLMDDNIPYVIYASYHPSRQNTQTRRLTWDMWMDVFRRVKDELTA
jgi:uracil-DNA glycosylase family 4